MHAFTYPSSYYLANKNFKEENDNYIFNFKYNSSYGPGVISQSKLFSKDGELLSSSSGQSGQTEYKAVGNSQSSSIELTYNYYQVVWLQDIPVQVSDPNASILTDAKVLIDATGIWILGGYSFGNGSTYRTFSIRTDLDGNFIFQTIHNAAYDFNPLGISNFQSIQTMVILIGRKILWITLDHIVLLLW